MCWSLKASIVSFTVGMLGCILLLTKKKALDTAAALIGFWVLSMQGLEALMWYDHSCKLGINQLASKVSLIQNLGQPIIIWLALLPFYSNTNKNIASILAFMYIVSLFLWLNNNKNEFKKQDFFCTQSKECKGLEWNWAKGSNFNFFWNIFVFVLLSMFFLVKNKFFAYIIGGYVAISLFLSYLQYGYTKAVGSWWCLYAVALPYLQYFFI